MLYNAYINIKIEPFKIISFQELKITHEINQHSTVYYTALIEESLKDTYIYDADEKLQTYITLTKEIPTAQDETVGDIENNTITIFTGIVSEITVTHVDNVCTLKVKAVSNSSIMDVEHRDRSFQNKDMTYKALIESIAKEYPMGDVKFTVENKPIEKYILQYQETDWQFCKRMASRFNTFLVPYEEYSGEKFFFGFPDRAEPVEVESKNYEIKKDVRRYLKESQNRNANLSLLDSVSFVVEHDRYIGLGDPVIFQNINLFVRKSEIEMIKGSIVYFYELSPEKGMSTETYDNHKITGLSIKGKVLDRIADRLKVHMAIDGTQDMATAWEFPYSTTYTAEGNGGWYCMPEIGDTVFVNHPSAQEGGAIAINGVRETESSGNKLTDPNVKYFRTAGGKELMFAPDKIMITAKDDETYIVLSEIEGIRMQSTLPINLITDSELNIEAGGKVIMNADDKIELTCQSSTVTLEPAEIKVEANEVKHN